MSSLFAFPGQGAQKPGMLQRLPEAPEVAATLAEAHERAYALADAIDWPGGFYRRDIGWRAL